MFERDVLPHVARAGGGAAIVSRTLHTFGVGESTVAEHLGDLMTRGRNPSVGTTVSGGAAGSARGGYCSERMKSTSAAGSTGGGGSVTSTSTRCSVPVKGKGASYPVPTAGPAS